MRQKFHLLYVFYCRPLSIDVADEKTLLRFIRLDEGKIVPVYAMKTYRTRKSTAPLTVNLDTR